MQDLLERARSSLFFVPMLFVVGGAGLGLAAVRLDQSLDASGSELPLVAESTVDSARAVLETVAGATMTVAGIAFSIALLIFQLSSSQYSPRVIEGLFRDEFNKFVMGLVVGTFTYCLVVLQTVRGPLGEEGERRIPSLSVSVAVLLGVLSVLAIVAFIDHNARMINVSQILHRITATTRERAQATWTPRADAVGPTTAGVEVPPAPGHVITLGRDGWIQTIDHDALLDAFAAGSVVRLEVAVGRFAIEGTPLLTVWPVPDPAEHDRLRSDALATVQIGKERTLTQDVPYGLRQLVDVGLRALSPGVNDPTTAQDAIFHAAAVLRELLASEPPAPARGTRDDRGRVLLTPEGPTPVDLVDLAFDELRVAAGPHPTVCLYLLEAIHLLCEASDLPAEVDERLRRQAGWVVAACEASEVLPSDLERVRDAHERRFGSGS